MPGPFVPASALTDGSASSGNANGEHQLQFNDGAQLYEGGAPDNGHHDASMELVEVQKYEVTHEPAPSFGNIPLAQRLRKKWAGSDVVKNLDEKIVDYAARHGGFQALSSEDVVKTKKKHDTRAMQILAGLVHEEEQLLKVVKDEQVLVEHLSHGWRDFVDDALEEVAHLNPNGGKPAGTASEFDWKACGNFHDVPALRRSQAENNIGPVDAGFASLSARNSPSSSSRTHTVVLFEEGQLGFALEWRLGESPIVAELKPAMALRCPRLKRGQALRRINGIDIEKMRNPRGEPSSAFETATAKRPLRLVFDVHQTPLAALTVMDSDAQESGQQPFAIDFVRDFCSTTRPSTAASAGDGVAWRVPPSAHGMHDDWDNPAIQEASEALRLPTIEKRIAELRKQLPAQLPGQTCSSGFGTSFGATAFGSSCGTAHLQRSMHSTWHSGGGGNMHSLV